MRRFLIGAVLAMTATVLTGHDLFAQQRSKSKIEFQPPKWVNPGPYKSSTPPNYGPGTNRSGPEGQRGWTHTPYAPNPKAYDPPVISPRKRANPKG